MKKDGNQLYATVIDKGIGFDIEKISNSKNTGIGLTSLSHRIKMIGGNLIIDSALGEGTKIKIIVDLKEESDTL